MNIAFIPVRGGSKGIPKKNIKKILGIPLVCYSVNSAIQSLKIDKVVIATDADYIIDVINEYYKNEPKVEIYIRSMENASDQASTESVMLEYSAKYEFDNMVLLQATSPLTTKKDLDGAVEKFMHSGCNSLLSVVKQKRFIWEKIGNNNVLPANYNHMERPRRQDFDGYYVENGAIYITTRKLLMESGNRLNQPITFWEMSEETYFEIDEPHDFDIIEQLIKNRKLDTSLVVKRGRIKLFLTDVDGVLTDAGMYYSENGDEMKKFNTRDGKGLEMLRLNGIKTGIVTSENTKIVERRASKLKLDFLFQGVDNKLEVIKALAQKEKLELSEIAYIGDDLNDLEVIKNIGISACPSNAVNEIKDNAMIVLSSKGGEGAVREFVELILFNN